MKIWVIRGRVVTEILKEFYDEYPQYLNKDNLKPNKYLYWSRNSRFDKKELVSIYVNTGSAKRAYKIAKKSAEQSLRKYMVDIESLELNLELPGED